jgi:hypothetical protein
MRDAARQMHNDSLNKFQCMVLLKQDKYYGAVSYRISPYEEVSGISATRRIELSGIYLTDKSCYSGCC